MVELAQTLEGPIIEQIEIALVRGDMVTDCGSCESSFALAHSTKWLRLELKTSNLLPSTGLVEVAIFMLTHGEDALKSNE